MHSPQPASSSKLCLTKARMNDHPYGFRYFFYPVGQGLFSAGLLKKVGPNGRPFLWVYDCGTSSSQKLVDLGISRLKTRRSPRKRLDLVIISHFDHDHISGICKLVETFRIGTLMLPYMPLAERLILGFEEGFGPTDNLIGFFINPVAYVLAQAGPGVERIIFVQASGGEGPTTAEGTPHGPEERDNDIDLDFEHEKPVDT